MIIPRKLSLNSKFFFRLNNWNKKTSKLYPSTPLENIDIEKRLEKKVFDVNSFNNLIKTFKEMVLHFKEKNIIDKAVQKL